MKRVLSFAPTCGKMEAQIEIRTIAALIAAAVAPRRVAEKMTADPHVMGVTPVMAGCLLFLGHSARRGNHRRAGGMMD